MNLKEGGSISEICGRKFCVLPTFHRFVDDELPRISETAVVY